MIPPEAGGPAPERIAYIVKMFPRLSETFITNEIAEAHRRGVDVLPISLLRPTGSSHSFEARRIAEETFYVPDLATGEGRRALLAEHRSLQRRLPGRYFRSLFLAIRRMSPTALKRFIQAGPVARFCLDAGVTHIHAGFAHVPASVAWWASRLTGIPFSFAAHAKDLYLSDPRSLRHKMDAARFVWTCTVANGEHLRALGSATPVQVGYHGCDLALGIGMRRTPSEGKPIVLAVGRLVPKKGLDDLLRAAALLRRDHFDAEIVIVGDGPMRASLEALATSLDLENVQFLGSLSQEKVFEEYARASLLVLPSVVLPSGDRDGIPNVLVEAMACGLPVVSTRVSAIPELVKDRETGILVRPHDPADLAAAIRETIEQPNAARQRALRARADVEERFDLHRNSEGIARVLARHARPTRAIYVTTDFGVPVRGHKGASAHVRQIAERMQAAGIELRVVTPSPGPTPPEGNPFDIPVEEVPPSGWLARIAGSSRGAGSKQLLREISRLLYNVPVWLHVRRMLGEIHPDFVYERYALCALATGLACRARGIPWILEVNAPLADEEAAHRTLRLGALTRALERGILRRADRVFVVSHALRKWAIETGVLPDRVEVLPNGVDRARFHPAVDGARARETMGWAGDEVVVGFAGSLKPWHGGLLLLEAFERARANSPALRLTFIGDGPERASIERRVRKRGLDPYVRFMGAVPQERIPSLLRACDILVAPYLPQDRFYFSPLKVLEYLAVGRPVVASRQGEIIDLVPPECGRLFEPGNRGELAGILVDLGRDPALRERMGACAAARAEGEDWADRVETVISSLPLIRAGEALWRPRVGYVLKMFPRFSETFVVNEILELERQGVDVRVFSMKHPGGARQVEAGRVRAAVSVLQRPLRAIHPRYVASHLRCMLRRPRAYFATLLFVLGRRGIEAVEKFIFAGYVADVARRERIGHLHAHFASGPARVAKLASLLSGIPFSFTAHAKDLYWGGHGHGENHKLKKRVRLARFVVTVSRANQQFIESFGFKVKNGRIRPIYIGLDLQEFRFVRPSARPRGPRPLILSVGRLIEKKGLGVLVDALAMLRDRGVPFRCVIAGEGPEEQDLRSRIAKRGLSGDVRLLGAVPLARLRRRYYSRARVLALPCIVAADGDRDGIPTVLLEAMASGVPVVSTTVSGIPEAIEDGVSGFLTSPGDAHALADRIRRILDDPALADSIAEKGRERVEEQFDLAKNAAELKRLFVRSMRGRHLDERGGELPAPAGGERGEQAVGTPAPAMADIGAEVAS